MPDKKRNAAYFSMEIGINKNIHTYSGGLGVLAGDTLKSAADLELPMLGVTLLHRKGFLRQKVDDNGGQLEEEDPWNIEEYLNPLDKEVNVNVQGRNVKVKAWQYDLKGITDEIIPIIFLDTNVEGNSDYDKSLTDRLYGGDQFYRLCQEVILGIGGVKMLTELGYKPRFYHMNEGHAALLTMELMDLVKEEQPGKNLEEYREMVRDKCVFTTHTPVPAGHDAFSHEMAADVLQGYPSVLLKFADISEGLNMTHLALKFSKHSNAVARKHCEVSKNMFPGYDIIPITNGVHSNTWINKYFKEVFDSHIPRWLESPESLREAIRINNDEIWKSHMKAKRDLIGFINENYNLGFEEDKFTIGFARRATGYKRANLLFKDIERLKKIVKEKGGIQIVYGGKAHPNDGEGKEIIKQILEIRNNIDADIKFVYLENYDIELAKKIIAGVDVWLNTPIRPNEASGTSGMKAAHNGVPSLSVLDGWWIEGHIEDITGWSIGEHYEEGENQDEVDANSMYEKLSKIIEMYYNDKDGWIRIMKNSIALNASYFNTHRMIKEYIAKSYFK